MPTPQPRISNVNPTKHFFHQACYRSLAQATPSCPARSCNTTLNAPELPLPKFTLSGRMQACLPQHLYPNEFTNMETKILAVDPQKLGTTTVKASGQDLIDEWEIDYVHGQDYESLKRAAQDLIHTNVPVAFPTETVYGLGADATRSSAVKAIFATKGRPADNPLIVHIHSLPQLRALLSGQREMSDGSLQAKNDSIPAIYRPLIERFWPGPLTIILPAPTNSILAPEVTAGLPTFGARMPRSILALSLLRLCGRPLAAPSANASTRPSPTAAEHVFDDLEGRIHTIIDGGPCEVGVESTVVDGLSHPPSILRPGGVTVDQLRKCPGWENVTIGYKDKQEGGADKPRAPGMKYRHYSPKAEVVLFEIGAGRPSVEELKVRNRIGIIRTKSWESALSLTTDHQGASSTKGNVGEMEQPAFASSTRNDSSRMSNLLRSVMQHQVPHAQKHTAAEGLEVWDINLGASTEDVARGLFSALRELDKKNVDVIYVEGIDDQVDDDIATAVMNRLRKAAEIRL
ncbi:DHBP synthase RibB-like alpha/beta domain-containing protein [Ampelomyces quisqualis]|uniref:Threonylcarbamoyl-AMP synthase n=1 Tax=Ampelomyces quisqualis TaxID=50730 RepID=A0A6A5QLB6_AMPQU|nr:DHBP synthase RibB-like alpha/beta domain-containing protein [Ampelomyces quisqualis]